MILTQEFFNRSTITVAKELLGKYLVCRVHDKTVALILNEVEAYDGPDDKACHAHKGKTKRTEVMFGAPGYFYVYLVYGMYWMLNIVTGPKEYPAAILIRGAGQFNGPGKLTKGLGINNRFNTKIALPVSGLWFEDREVKIMNQTIVATPRIGVSYAGEIWANKLYRFEIGV